MGLRLGPSRTGLFGCIPAKNFGVRQGGPALKPADTLRPCARASLRMLLRERSLRQLAVLFCLWLLTGLAAPQMPVAHAETPPTDADGDLVSVLKIEQKPGAWLDRLIDANYCRFENEHTFEEYISHGRYVVRTYKEWDCAFQVGRHPEVRAFPVQPNIRFSTIDGVPDWNGLKVPLLFVDLMIDEEALGKAVTFGFSQGSSGSNILSYAWASGELLPFRKATALMRDGRTRAVFRAFLPLAEQGQAEGCTIRRATFKPFLGVASPAGGLTRVWDNARGTGFWTDYSVTNFIWRGQPVCLPYLEGLVDRTNEVERLLPFSPK